MAEESASARKATGSKMAIAVLRALVDAGYLSPQQLTAIEASLSAKASNAAPGKRWLTIDEACRYAMCGRTTMWKYRNAGLLSVRKVGVRRLIERGELDAFIQAGPPPADRLMRMQSDKAFQTHIGRNWI